MRVVHLDLPGTAAAYSHTSKCKGMKSIEFTTGPLAFLPDVLR